MAEDIPRRKLLAVGASMVSVGLAGCSVFGGSDLPPPKYGTQTETSTDDTPTRTEPEPVLSEEEEQFFEDYSNSVTLAQNGAENLVRAIQAFEQRSFSTAESRLISAQSNITDSMNVLEQSDFQNTAQSMDEKAESVEILEAVNQLESSLSTLQESVNTGFDANSARSAKLEDKYRNLLNETETLAQQGAFAIPANVANLRQRYIEDIQ